MGNTRSWPEREACAPTAATPRALSERQAFDLATAWHDALSSFVRLDVVSHYRRTDIDYGSHTTSETRDPSAENFEVVDHLEWIDFDLRRGPSGGDYRDAVGAARATAFAWFTLACCPGFGVDEDPVFWKRVFSAFTRADATNNRGCYRRGGTVNDRARFFEHADRLFPRVRFCVFPGFPVALLWEGTPPARHEQQLRRVMDQLKSFVCASRWQERNIAVSLRVDNCSSATELAWRLRSMDLAPHVAGVHSSKLRLTAVYYVASVYAISLAEAVACFPHARLCVLKNDSMWLILHASDAAALTSMLTRQQSAPSAGFARVDVQNVDLWVWQRQEMVRMRGMVSSWCSLLPHLSTVKSVSFTHLDEMGDRADQFATWVGYALFHPDIARQDASVENLTLRLTNRHRFVAPALTRMRQGNNLLINSEEPTELITGYHQARVRSGTIVRANPEIVEGENALYQFPTEGWITVCVSKQRGVSLRASQWIRVVLPGDGLAWIASADVLDVVCHQPDEPDELAHDILTALLDVLSIVGSGLTHTSLQELELSITNTLYALSAAQLHSLRLLSIACGRPSRFSTHRGTVLEILARYPSLAYFNWHYTNASKHCNDTTVSYDAHREEMLKLLAPPSPGAEAYHMIAVPFRLDARLAFLSVVRHYARTTSNSRIAQLPQDVTSLIFQFSSSYGRRDIHIRD